MISILELKAHYEEFQRGKLFKKSIRSFIDYIESEQKKNKRAGAISMEKRDGAQRLKELKERQEKEKPITPEDDFKNLKD